MLEKKSINKENWKRIKKRKQASCEIIESDEYIGVANLLKIQSCSEPLIKHYSKTTNVKIVDNGYYWLQVALEGKKYWITAMYDQNKELIQYYIDITYKNEIFSNKEAYFYDLFLDIVYFENRVILLDEDELSDALKLNIISKEQFNVANEVASDILNNLIINKEKLDKFCLKYLEKLEKEMEK